VAAPLVSLEQFSGPLDLLLHLVRTAEMDIFDLDVARITEDYLHFIDEHGVRDLAEAYQFLALAASLVELKSRLLLPRQPKAEVVADGMDEAEDDPRLDLARRLAAYEGIQGVTAELAQRYEQVSALWPRQLEVQLQAEILYSLDSLSVYDLMSAFAEVAARPRFKQITIFKDDYDVDEARQWLRGRLGDGSRGMVELLSEQPDLFSLLVAFIALLELIKDEVLTFDRSESGIVISLSPTANVI
jgi:segregation and condensation protein A